MSGAVNVLTPLTRTLKIAPIMLTGKMFSEYSICDKQALIKLLKAKGCSTKDEIDTFIVKSSSLPLASAYTISLCFLQIEGYHMFEIPNMSDHASHTSTDRRHYTLPHIPHTLLKYIHVVPSNIPSYFINVLHRLLYL